MRGNSRFAIALHVLALLAYRNGDPVSSQILASSVNTNPVIIRRLLCALRKVRLVDTGRGPRAGSRLSRSAARITLAEVYAAVCGRELFCLPGRKPNRLCPVGRGILRALKPVLTAAQDALARDLHRTSVADLLDGIRRPASQRQSRRG